MVSRNVLGVCRCVFVEGVTECYVFTYLLVSVVCVGVIGRCESSAKLSLKLEVRNRN